jgi:hypothetical protein
MVIRECVWEVCVYISCTGDEGQLGSSFLWNGRGGLGWAGHLSKKLAVRGVKL